MKTKTVINKRQLQEDIMLGLLCERRPITTKQLPDMANEIVKTKSCFSVGMHLGEMFLYYVGIAAVPLMISLGWKLTSAPHKFSSCWYFETKEKSVVLKCYKLGFPISKSAANAVGVKPRKSPREVRFQKAIASMIR